MTNRFWVLSFVLAFCSFESIAICQEKTPPASKPESQEADSAKSRRDRLAAEVKKSVAKTDSIEKDKDTAKARVQLLALSGNYVDFNDAMSIDPTSLLLGGAPAKQKSFYRLCEFIDGLAAKSSIDWIVFDLSDPSLSMNPAQLEEISRRIAKVKRAGKRLVAWLENASSEHLSLAALTGGYVFWKRKRKAKNKPGESTERTRIDPKQEAATALYRSLEVALLSQGISRPPCLPPLKHAEELTAKSHPLAGDILSLTNRYLEARFGGNALSEDAAKDFERKVRDIRTYKPAPASTGVAI